MAATTEGNVATAASDQPSGQGQRQQQTWGQLLKSVVIQMVIIYFITSFFRGKQSTDKGSGVVASNLFPDNTKMVETLYYCRCLVCYIVLFIFRSTGLFHKYR